MSTILRTTNFIRRLNIGDWRINLLHRTNQNVLLKTSCQLSQESATLRDIKKESYEVDKLFNNVRARIHVIGFSSYVDLEKILKNVTNNANLTKANALSLLQFCNYIGYSESLKARTLLSNNIWDTIKRLGIELDVSFYNALLQVYLINYIEFNPNDILLEMKEKNIKPNRLTFQRLIEQYSRKGDIDSATKALEIMNEENIPINEDVFDSLIKGHAVSGNESSALNIINIMIKTGITPSSNTYVEILCMYAQNGNIEMIKNTLKECEQKKRIVFKNKDILEVIYSLAINKHSEYIKELIPLLQTNNTYNKTTIQYINMLIEKHLLDEALLLFKTLPSLRQYEESNQGKFFIKKMVNSEVNASTIIKYCQILSSQIPNQTFLEYALFMSYWYKLPDLAFPLLEAIKKSGQIKEHYFFPLLVSHRNNVEDLQNILRNIHSTYNNILSHKTLDKYVIPYMKSNPNQQFEDLLVSGYSYSRSANVIAFSLFKRSTIEQACNFMFRHRLSYDIGSLKEVIVQAFWKNKNINNFIDILCHQRKYKNKLYPNSNDVLVLELISQYSANDLLMQKIISALKEKNLSISEETASLIKKHLGEKLNDSLEKDLSQLTSNNIESTVEEQDNKEHYKLFKFTEPELVKIQDYMIANDTEAIKKLIEELEQQNFLFSSYASECIMNYFGHTNNVEISEKWFKKIFENDPEYKINIDTLFNYANVLISNKNIDDAVKIIESTEVVTTDSSKLITRNIRFFDNLVLNYPDQITEILKLLNDLGYTKEMEKSLAIVLYKKCMIENNGEAACKIFKWFYDNFNSLHYNSILLKYFIKCDDIDHLQYLTDICVNTLGKPKALFNLGINFLECHKLQQAKKILSINNVVTRTRIKPLVDFYVKKGEASMLLNLINIINKSYPDIEELCYELIKLYDKHKDLESCEALHQQLLQGNEFTLSFGFLQHLNEVINKLKSKTVKTDERNEEQIQKDLHSVKKDDDLEVIEKYLECNKVTEALNIIQQKLEQKNYSYSKEFSKILMQTVHKLVCLDDFTNIINIVEKIKRNNSKFIHFSKEMNQFYLNENKYNNFLTHFENLINDLENSIKISFIFHCESATKAILNLPEIKEKFKDIAYKAADKKIYGPINALWVAELIRESSEMETIWETYLKFNKFYSFAALYSLENLNAFNKYPILCEKIVDSHYIKIDEKKRCFSQIFSILQKCSVSNKYDILYDCLIVGLKIMTLDEINEEIVVSLKTNLNKDITLESLKEASLREIQSVAA